MIAFYVTCFTISWGLWSPQLLTGSDIAELFAFVGLFGPALACIIVAHWSTPLAQLSPPKRRWLTFLSVWFTCTLLLVIYQRLHTLAIPVAVQAVSAVLALIPTYVIYAAIAMPSAAAVS